MRSGKEMSLWQSMPRAQVTMLLAVEIHQQLEVRVIHSNALSSSLPARPEIFS